MKKFIKGYTTVEAIIVALFFMVAVATAITLYNILPKIEIFK